MRIIGGSAKGTKLKTPKGASVRPTADRVKEALFSIIAPRLPGSVFLDLFAGSGAVGIEALSRGAGECVFVENKKENTALIKENLSKTGLSKYSRVIFKDTKKAINILARQAFKADLIYLDPPYVSQEIPEVINQLLEMNIFNENSLTIVEHSHRNVRWMEKLATSLHFTAQKKYGDTCLTFIQVSSPLSWNRYNEK